MMIFLTPPEVISMFFLCNRLCVFGAFTFCRCLLLLFLHAPSGGIPRPSRRIPLHPAPHVGWHIRQFLCACNLRSAAQRSQGAAKTKTPEKQQRSKLNRRIRKTLSTVSDQKKCINIFVLLPFYFGQKSLARLWRRGSGLGQSPLAAASSAQLQIFGNSANVDGGEGKASERGTYDRTEGLPIDDYEYLLGDNGTDV